MREFAAIQKEVPWLKDSLEMQAPQAELGELRAPRWMIFPNLAESLRKHVQQIYPGYNVKRIWFRTRYGNEIAKVQMGKDETYVLEHAWQGKSDWQNFVVFVGVGLVPHDQASYFQNGCLIIYKLKPIA